jgi:hypothetical protein
VVDDEWETGSGEGAPSFEAHYRSLITDAARRSAEGQAAVHRALGHRLRARRAERSAAELARLLAGAEPRPLVPARGGLWRAVRVAWAAAVVLLVAGLTAAGVHSWWTGGTDLAVITLSFAWFYLDTRPAPAQALSDGVPELPPEPAHG